MLFSSVLLEIHIVSEDLRKSILMMFVSRKKQRERTYNQRDGKSQRKAYLSVCRVRAEKRAVTSSVGVVLNLVYVRSEHRKHPKATVEVL